MTPASSQRAVTPRPVRAGGPSHRSRTPVTPRRVSGPVKRPQNRPLTRHPGRFLTRPSVRDQPLRTRAAAAAAAFVRSLPDHRWLDRLVRGRAWIPFLGVLLAGIVATQVEVLKLGASMGRWVSRTAALTSHNQALQASVATLSNGQRIERLATQMGMVMPAPTDVNFVTLHPAGGTRGAIGRIHVPDPSLFLANLSADEAAALAQATPAVPAQTSTAVAPATQTGLATVGATSAGAAPSTTAPATTTAPVAPAAAPTTTVTSPAPASTVTPTSPSGGVSQTGG